MAVLLKRKIYTVIVLFGVAFLAYTAIYSNKNLSNQPHLQSEILSSKWNVDQYNSHNRISVKGAAKNVVLPVKIAEKVIKFQNDWKHTESPEPVNSSTNQVLHDLEGNSSLLTLCEVLPVGVSLNHRSYEHVIPLPITTFQGCRVVCQSGGYLYATLMRGECICTNFPHRYPAIDLRWCKATCTDGDASCHVSRLPHAITMKTGLNDGQKHWTEWMSAQEVNTQVRYRNCLRDKQKSTSCLPEFQRKKLSKSFESVDLKFLGCFTSGSIKSSASAYQSDVVFGAVGHRRCREICQNKSFLYAAVTVDKEPVINKSCYCVNSLAQSQPSVSCPGIGLAVYLALTATTNISLEFEGEVKKKGKVLVLARYRSGSSMTQSFFVRNPNSFSWFEPDKLQASHAEGKADWSTLMAVEALFRCNVARMPSFLHNSGFITWATKMIRQRGAYEDNHVTDVLECYQRSPITDCAPYLKEACERSEFIDIKLIRVFDVDFIKEFAERNPDVHIVHLVRDPKSLIAAQARFGTRLSPKALCGQLVRIGRLIRELKERGFSNAHEVFYEELAIDPVKYGKIIYDEMGLEMVEDVKRFLSREEYKEGQAIPKNASQVVVDNPVYHRYKFLEVFQLETILKIDKECKDVYDFWPSHYTDLSTMIRKYRADVVKYSSAHNRVMIQNYFPT